MRFGTQPPPDVIDPLLWRDAQLMLGRHAEPGYDHRCVWCGYRWPCPARRLAERAALVARRPARGVVSVNGNGRHPSGRPPVPPAEGRPDERVEPGQHTAGSSGPHEPAEPGRHAAESDGRRDPVPAQWRAQPVAHWNDPSQHGSEAHPEQWQLPAADGWADPEAARWHETGNGSGPAPVAQPAEPGRLAVPG